LSSNSLHGGPPPGRRTGLLGLALATLSCVTWEIDSRVGGIPVTAAQWAALGLLALGGGFLALSLADTWRAWRLGRRPWFLVRGDGPWSRALFAPASRRAFLRLALAAVAVVTGGFVLQASLLGPVFPIDDAYITLRNAETTGQRVDSVFGNTLPWLGSTSLLHTTLVFLLGHLAKGPWASEVAGWLGAVAYALGIVRLAAATRSSVSVTALSLVFGLLGGPTAFLLGNGMETGLVLATVTWGLALAIDPRPAWALPAIAGAMPFVRPELAALSAPLLVAWATKRTRAPPGPARTWARGLLVAGAVAIPLALLSLAQTGTVIPATVGAKAAWFAEGCAPGRIRTATVAVAIRQFSRDLGPAVLCAVFLLSARAGLAILFFSGAVLASFWWFLPGGLFHNDHRYLAAFVPAVVLGGMLAPRLGTVARNLALGVLAWGAIHSLEHLHLVLEHHASTVGFTRTELAPLATWIEANTPVDAVLLVHDVGYVARGSHRRMVDLVGLKSPSSVEVHRRITLAGCGRERSVAISEIAKASDATHLVVLDGWERAFSIAAGLRANGWTVKQLRDGAYKVYRILPPIPAG
jgi:hypothetical protein